MSRTEVEAPKIIALYEENVAELFFDCLVLVENTPSITVPNVGIQYSAAIIRVESQTWVDEAWSTLNAHNRCKLTLIKSKLIEVMFRRRQMPSY